MVYMYTLSFQLYAKFLSVLFINKTSQVRQYVKTERGWVSVELFLDEGVDDEDLI